MEICACLLRWKWTASVEPMMRNNTLHAVQRLGNRQSLLSLSRRFAKIRVNFCNSYDCRFSLGKLHWKYVLPFQSNLKLAPSMKMLCSLKYTVLFMVKLTRIEVE